MERIRNLNKANRKKNKGHSHDTGMPKRPKLSTAKDQLLRRYPIKFGDSVVEDRDSIAQHTSAIEEEMKRAKPRQSVLLPLMKKTFHNRWEFVQHDAVSVKDTLEKFPALKLAAMVSFADG